MKNKINLKKEINFILSKFFKQKNKFFSMDNTKDWDSLNHFRLMILLQKKFSINISNRDIAKLIDEKKIFVAILKKVK
tara:strand:+ start:224 stop:457 length:234 start_codon:yes stop_codon:yes gene_type:complete